MFSLPEAFAEAQLGSQIDISIVIKLVRAQSKCKSNNSNQWLITRPKHSEVQKCTFSLLIQVYWIRAGPINRHLGYLIELASLLNTL